MAKRLIMITLASLVIASSAFAAGETYLTITKKGRFQKRVNVSDWEPGEKVITIDKFYWVWNGEETIDYKTKRGYLYINGKIKGVNLNRVSTEKVKYPDRIHSVYIKPKYMPELTKYPNLDAVKFSSKRLDDGDLSWISGLGNLHILNLHDARFTDLGLCQSPVVTAIEDLNLTCQIGSSKTPVSFLLTGRFIGGSGKEF